MKGFRKYCFLCVAVVGVLGSSCDTERNVEDPDVHYFVKYYGGDGNQQAVDFQALDDGSFLLLGNYIIGFENEIYALRVDARGEIIWEKRFSEEGTSIAKDLEPTDDGNFIILADYQNGAQTDFKLLKISTDGTVLAKADACGTVADEDSRTVTLLADGGFIVSGTTDSTAQWTPSSPGSDPGDTFSFRFDRNLARISSINQWGPETHGFGSQEGAQFDVAIKTIHVPATQNTSERFYVFGHTNSNVNGNNPTGQLGLFYFERGPTGSVVGVFYPGNVNMYERIQFVEPVPSQLGGGVLIIGTSQVNVGLSEIFIARLRNQLTYNRGNDATLYRTVPLNRNIEGVSAATSLTGTVGFLILGNEVRATGYRNIWVSKMDQSGIVLWSSTFGSEGEDDIAAAALELPDGKIMVLGTMGLADDQSKMSLMKLNPRGQLLK